MTGFADRLVARFTGQTQGADFSLLKPRPASRFEISAPDMGVDDLTVEAREAAIQAPQPADMTNRNELRTVRSVANHSSHATRKVDKIARSTKEPQPQQLDIPTGEQASTRTLDLPSPIDDRSARPTEDDAPDVNASFISEQRQNENAEVSRMPPSASDTQDHDNRHQQSLNTLAVMKVQPAPAPLQTTRTLPHDVAAPVPPSISIGRIEVQFLPRENPALALAQAPRTRGFDAYARARRGAPH
jgi:hypothetical protein